VASVKLDDFALGDFTFDVRLILSKVRTAWAGVLLRHFGIAVGTIEQAEHEVPFWAG
jgi:hypothetical protein